MAATTTFPLWRWLVRLSILQGVVQAFVPSILQPTLQTNPRLTPRFPVAALLAPPSCLGVQQSRRRAWSSFSLQTSKTSDETVDESYNYVEAEDLDGLQDLFNRYCDREGLMTMKAVQQIPAIAELLEDVSASEFDQIWRHVDKFPEAGAANDDDDEAVPKRTPTSTKRPTQKKKEERIDVDSFVKLYRAIDDLFEDEIETTTTTKTAVANGKTAPVTDQASVEKAKNPADVTAKADKEDDPVMEEELESIFQQLCDAGGLLSKDQLRAWDEVGALFKEGLLGEDEFNRIWEGTTKSPGTTDKLDEQGFLYFNVALDDLFEFDDEDEQDDTTVDSTKVDQESPSVADSFAPRMVAGEDLSPDVLFVALANEDGLVGRDELSRWSELQDMLEEGDILESELEAFFAKATKAEKDSTKLDEIGFTELFQAIDDLFEDESDEISAGIVSQEAASDQASAVKEELLEAIDLLKDDDFLPCGLDALETEQKEIMAIVDRLEKFPSNLVRSRQGNINTDDMSGTWELIYSSSSAMKFNKGLSGLGGSFPNGKFSSLKQKLSSNKFMSDVEYTEHIAVKPSSASFDVTVTGSWSLRKSISLFTGEATIILAVEPDRVSYGPTSTRADHWKSLGPMNYLDLLYLDDDLRIMRGNTSMNTIFILRRLA